MTHPRRVIVFDPGLKTGVCIFEQDVVGEPILEWSGEIDEHEVAPLLRGQLKMYPDLEVVVERFVITVATAKKTQATYSLELIGVIKQCLRDVSRPVTDINFQSPSDAMNLFPNTALKTVGYWHVGGAGHALDAIRHGLLRFVKTGWKPTRLLDD